MTTSRIAAAVAAAFVLSGCTFKGPQKAENAPPGRMAANTSTFPLFRPNDVVDVKALDTGPMVAAFRRNDPHDTSANYRGSEVILATTASLPELQAWLRKLEEAPPQGLRSTHAGMASSSESQSMRDAGAVAASFEAAHGDRIVLVFAVDPKQLRSKLGPALDLVDKYDKVPALLRGPIDTQMKEQLGYSVSEMLDSSSPVGVAFRGLKTAESRNRRAIVLIDQKKAE